MAEMFDVAIVGGGAAGLAAAIFAAQTRPIPPSVIILDAARSLGAKILVSGGGRCNVTNEAAAPRDYNGSPNIVRNVLSAFDVAATERWFKSLGVTLKREETGKLFPTTDSARTVLDALLDRCRDLGVMIQCGARVSRIQAPSTIGQTFVVEHTSGMVQATRIILATGGKSLPRSGSDGSGWELACALGHTVTPTYQSLVPLVLDATMFHARLAGVSQTVELSTFAGDGKRIDRRCGSLLWTHFGISGPVVMDASRHWVIARETGRRPRMTCNFVAPDGFEETERWLTQVAQTRPRMGVENVVAQRIPQRCAAALVGHVKIDASMPIGQVPREARRALVHALTALPLPVTQPRGWNYAEVTAGGVPLAEIDYRTMESRKVHGLYLVGEMLDCDGRIGGFNFQWAWATGCLAGTAAGRQP